MVDEVQRQKQKPKTIRGKNIDLKTLKKIKDSSKSNKMLEKILEDKKDEETKKEIKRDPRQEPYIPRDYLNNPPTRKEIEQYFAEFAKNSNAKGGMINKYAKGGSVKKNKMITTKGWGASRKT